MIRDRLYFNVYTRLKWADSWVYQPYISPVELRAVIAPGVGTAQLRLHYGHGMFEDGTAMTDGSAAESFRRVYVKICSTPNADRSGETMHFVGWIPAEQFNLLGANGTTKTMDQILEAQDFSTLLETRIDGGWVQPRGIEIGSCTPVKIDRIPVFNKRYAVGGSVVGNRSALPKVIDGKTATYIFSDAGNHWNNWQILNYLLTHFQDDTGPVFTLNTSAAIRNVLEAIVGVYDLAGRSLRSAVNSLLPRSRGMVWFVRVMPDDSVEIYVQSTLQAALSVGSVTLPANDNQTSLDLWQQPEHTQVVVRQDSSLFYDKITVRGGKIKSCFTVSVADGSLVPAWTDTTETRYKTALKGKLANYDKLPDAEQASKNDAYRSGVQFQRVFAVFRIPADWDWVFSYESTDYVVNPQLDDAGEITGSPAAYWNVDKHLLGWLPLQEDCDYTQVTVVDNNPAAEKEFLPVQAYIADADGNYILADKAQPHAAVVRARQREMSLEVRFEPAYLFARNHWDGAQPGMDDDFAANGSFDYSSLMATVFIETDQFVAVSAQITAGTVENLRHLVINVPDAELWYVVPHTVVGVAANGSPERFGCSNNLLRDDRDRLRQILAAAVSFYGRRRNKLVISVDDIYTPVFLAQLIRDVTVAGDSQPAEAGTIVTSVVMDFEGRQTTIMTDWFVIDFIGTGLTEARAAEDVGTTQIPTLHAAATKLETHAQQIKEVTQQLNQFPQKIPRVKNSRIVIGEIVSIDRHDKFTARLYNEAGTLQTDTTTILCDVADVPYLQPGRQIAAVRKQRRWFCVGLYDLEEMLSSSSRSESSRSEISSSSASSGMSSVSSSGVISSSSASSARSSYSSSSEVSHSSVSSGVSSASSSGAVSSSSASSGMSSVSSSGAVSSSSASSAMSSYSSSSEASASAVSELSASGSSAAAEAASRSSASRSAESKSAVSRSAASGSASSISSASMMSSSSASAASWHSSSSSIRAVGCPDCVDLLKDHSYTVYVYVQSTHEFIKKIIATYNSATNRWEWNDTGSTDYLYLKHCDPNESNNTTITADLGNNGGTNDTGPCNNCGPCPFTGVIEGSYGAMTFEFFINGYW